MKNEEESKTPLACRLRLSREMAGLSQGQAAKLMDLHRPSLTEIEAGRRKVSAEELMKFAQIYGVSISWLTSTETPHHDSLLLAARVFEKLKKEDIDYLLKLLAALPKENEHDTKK